jgi:hypothetical protein
MTDRYIDSDVGATGGSGTQGDPWGIITAIANIGTGDVAYWRPGVSGVVEVPGGVNFNGAGTADSPICWIATDNDWVPWPSDVAPVVGIDADGEDVNAITVSGARQTFQGIRAQHTLNGRAGSKSGWNISAGRQLLRNCLATDCGIGLSSGQQQQLVASACTAHDVAIGFKNAINLGSAVPTYTGCLVYDTESDAFSSIGSCIVAVGCRGYSLGGAGVRLYKDNVSGAIALVDHCSFHDCVDGVCIDAFTGTYGSAFRVANCIFSECSGYGVNVTTPAGQQGLILNSAFYACTSGRYPAGRTGIVTADLLDLAANPFVDADNGDLRLVRSTPCIGAAMDGGDLGALQRRKSRIAQPVLIGV